MTDKIREERLKELFHYNPHIGLFVRLKTINGLSRKGYIAGCKNSEGYLGVSIDNKGYKIHRLAWFYMYGVWPKEIDHINHDRSDNRIENLREVTPQENQRNRPMSILNTSGTVGVTFNAKRKKWIAFIRYDGKQRYLGGFDDINDAVVARKEAEKEHGYHENSGR